MNLLSVMSSQLVTSFMCMRLSKCLLRPRAVLKTSGTVFTNMDLPAGE